jgi:hypothetical protein
MNGVQLVAGSKLPSSFSEKEEITAAKKGGQRMAGFQFVRPDGFCVAFSPQFPPPGMKVLETRPLIWARLLARS